MPTNAAALDVDCAEKFKILSDPTRLAVIQLLLEGPRRVGELNEVLCIEQSLLSHHLRILRDAEFVVAVRCGKGVRYDLSPQYRSSRKSTLDFGCCAISFEPPATS